MFRLRAAWIASSGDGRPAPMKPADWIWCSWPRCLRSTTAAYGLLQMFPAQMTRIDGGVRYCSRRVMALLRRGGCRIRWQLRFNVRSSCRTTEDCVLGGGWTDCAELLRSPFVSFGSMLVVNLGCSSWPPVGSRKGYGYQGLAEAGVVLRVCNIINRLTIMT